MGDWGRGVGAWAWALLLLVACSGNSDQGSPTGSTCPQNATLTYANFGQTFIGANCLGCHAGRQSPTLTTLAAVQAARDAVDRAAAAGPNATNTYMPKDHDVAVAQRLQLGEWLACGAP
jgi:hypothetical protein